MPLSVARLQKQKNWESNTLALLQHPPVLIQAAVFSAGPQDVLCARLVVQACVNLNPPSPPVENRATPLRKPHGHWQ